MTANAGTTPQSTVVSTAFANALAVTVKDAGSNPVSGVNVTFTAPWFGRIRLVRQQHSDDHGSDERIGVALAPFTANATAGGPYTVTAASTGLTSVSFSLTNTTGAATKLVFSVEPTNVGAGATITPAAQVKIEDALGNLVTSAANSVTIAIGTNPSSGTLGGTLTAIAVGGVATFSNLNINNAGTGYTLTANATGLAGATSTAFNVTSSNTMSIAVPGSLVGVARSITGTVTVSPAPTSTLTVTLSSNNTSLATVSPLTITIGAGLTTGTFTLNGIAAGGPVTLQATATGYPTATTTINVTSSLISLATGLILAPGQTSSLAVSLSTPAPTGGVTINFASLDTTIATITPSVFIPAGALVPSSNPQVTGVAIGTVNINATATGFAPDTRPVQVTVTASANPTSLGITATRTGTIQGISAPQRHHRAVLPLQPCGDNTKSIATVPLAVTIPAGNLSATITVTGVAAGTANLTITSTGINTVVVPLTVAAAPAITVSAPIFGNNMIVQGSVSIPIAPATSEVMTIASSDPTHFLLTTDQTKVGTASITVQLTTSNNSVPAFYIEGQNHTGTTAITATPTASATGYTTGLAQ